MAVDGRFAASGTSNSAKPCCAARSCCRAPHDHVESHVNRVPSRLLSRSPVQWQLEGRCSSAEKPAFIARLVSAKLLRARRKSITSSPDGEHRQPGCAEGCTEATGRTATATCVRSAQFHRRVGSFTHSGRQVSCAKSLLHMQHTRYQALRHPARTGSRNATRTGFGITTRMRTGSCDCVQCVLNAKPVRR